MIKILFFIETLKSGGAEKVMIDLVNHMDQTKFDITVQTVWPCDAKKYLAPGIRYKSTYGSENKANHLRYRAEAESGLAYRLHIKDDYDIECAYIEMGPTKVLASSTNKKAKKLAWVHCDLSKKNENIDAFVSKSGKQYRQYDEVICVSETARESFRKMFGDTPPSRVLYNVFDDKEIHRKAKEPLEIQTNGTLPIVAAVGRLSKEKGYDRLLRVSRRLLDDGIKHFLRLLILAPDVLDNGPVAIGTNHMAMHRRRLAKPPAPPDRLIERLVRIAQTDKRHIVAPLKVHAETGNARLADQHAHITIRETAQGSFLVVV